MISMGHSHSQIPQALKLCAQDDNRVLERLARPIVHRAHQGALLETQIAADQAQVQPRSFGHKRLHRPLVHRQAANLAGIALHKMHVASRPTGILSKGIIVRGDHTEQAVALDLNLVRLPGRRKKPDV